VVVSVVALGAVCPRERSARLERLKSTELSFREPVSSSGVGALGSIAASSKRFGAGSPAVGGADPKSD